MKHIPKIINITGIRESKHIGTSAEQGKVPYIEQIRKSHSRRLIENSGEHSRMKRIPLLEQL